ncbi:MAG: DNA-3-methyladenine glycosylase family protein [Ilumatobacteraceae bacterium]
MARTVSTSAGEGRAVASCLSAYRFGTADPTTRLTTDEFWRGSFTPHGPGTLRIRWVGDRIDAEAWGPGREWLLDRVGEMTGALDPGFVFADAHAAVMRAQRNHPGVRFGASRMFFHELLPTILGQRVTAGEALRQWRVLCLELGEPAPGPGHGLLLPPSPAALLAKPGWWFHPLGIEAKRAQALRAVAKHSAKLWQWAELLPGEAGTKLALLPGVGPWTVGSVLGSAMGDPDAVAVGDFHLKNLVSFNLAGEPRGTDERMLELLAPYRGQRGRVVRLLQLGGHPPPVFGPRQRILPMAQW